MFVEVAEQHSRMDAACRIRGSTTSPSAAPRATVVVLAQRTGDAWQVADHFVLEQPGKFSFVTGPGTYALAAFEDRNDDLVYQPGEPLLRSKLTMTCTSGESFDDIAMVIPERGGDRLEQRFDIAQLQARTPRDQLHATLGQVTAVGEIAALSDARFSEARAASGLWRPVDFLLEVGAGVYFLEPYSAQKVPVLFVHGISGSPANFTAMIERLDRTRFQPWVYHFPSGMHLSATADHLAQAITKLQRLYDFDELVVVAHSMGGLVARGFLQRYHAAGGRARLPLFISLSTPWGGSRAAAFGVATSPVAVHVWEDMVPGSAYLTSLFAAPLPAGTKHYLLFTPRDKTVSPDSQLLPQARREAAATYGFDETHMGVLKNADVSALVNRLLAEVAR